MYLTRKCTVLTDIGPTGFDILEWSMHETWQTREAVFTQGKHEQQLDPSKLINKYQGDTPRRAEDGKEDKSISDNDDKLKNCIF